MLAGAACGCGVDNNSEPDSTAESVGATENLSEGFDWEKVKQDITFEGKKIDFPFCVNDLGEGYEMDYLMEYSTGVSAPSSSNSGLERSVFTRATVPE